MTCRCQQGGGFVRPIILPRLTPDDVALVEAKVREMLAYVVQGGRRQMFEPVGDESRSTVNLQAHAAELAWSRYRGMGWGRLFVPGSTFHKLADMEDGREVRHSKYTTAHLPLHLPGIGRAKDDPDAFFDLVTGEIPDFVWRGWIRARDGQQQHWWREKGPGMPFAAYFVPQGALHWWPPHEPSEVTPTDRVCPACKSPHPVGTTCR